MSKFAEADLPQWLDAAASAPLGNDSSDSEDSWDDSRIGDGAHGDDPDTGSESMPMSAHTDPQQLIDDATSAPLCSDSSDSSDDLVTEDIPSQEDETSTEEGEGTDDESKTSGSKPSSRAAKTKANLSFPSQCPTGKYNRTSYGGGRHGPNAAGSRTFFRRPGAVTNQTPTENDADAENYMPGAVSRRMMVVESSSPFSEYESGDGRYSARIGKPGRNSSSELQRYSVEARMNQRWQNDRFQENSRAEALRSGDYGSRSSFEGRTSRGYDNRDGDNRSYRNYQTPGGYRSGRNSGRSNASKWDTPGGLERAIYGGLQDMVKAHWAECDKISAMLNTLKNDRNNHTDCRPTTGRGEQFVPCKRRFKTVDYLLEKQRVHAVHKAIADVGPCKGIAIYRRLDQKGLLPILKFGLYDYLENFLKTHPHFFLMKDNGVFHNRDNIYALFIIRALHLIYHGFHMDQIYDKFCYGTLYDALLVYHMVECLDITSAEDALAVVADEFLVRDGPSVRLSELALSIPSIFLLDCFPVFTDFYVDRSKMLTVTGKIVSSQDHGLRVHFQLSPTNAVLVFVPPEVFGGDSRQFESIDQKNVKKKGQNGGRENYHLDQLLSNQMVRVEACTAYNCDTQFVATSIEEIQGAQFDSSTARSDRVTAPELTPEEKSLLTRISRWSDEEKLRIQTTIAAMEADKEYTVEELLERVRDNTPEGWPHPLFPSGYSLLDFAETRMWLFNVEEEDGQYLIRRTSTVDEHMISNFLKHLSDRPVDRFWDKEEVFEKCMKTRLGEECGIGSREEFERRLDEMRLIVTHLPWTAKDQKSTRLMCLFPHFVWDDDLKCFVENIENNGL